MLKILGIVILVIIGLFFLLGLVYVVAGIQARAWIDVINKVFDDKFTNKN